MHTRCCSAARSMAFRWRARRADTRFDLRLQRCGSALSTVHGISILLLLTSSCLCTCPGSQLGSFSSTHDANADSGSCTARCTGRSNAEMHGTRNTAKARASNSLHTLLCCSLMHSLQTPSNQASPAPALALLLLCEAPLAALRAHIRALALRLRPVARGCALAFRSRHRRSSRRTRCRRRPLYCCALRRPVRLAGLSSLVPQRNALKTLQ